MHAPTRLSGCRAKDAGDASVPTPLYTTPAPTDYM
jgi:hypothetical protein